jgi:hypothetical protein
MGWCWSRARYNTTRVNIFLLLVTFLSIAQNVVIVTRLYCILCKIFLLKYKYFLLSLPDLNSRYRTVAMFVVIDLRNFITTINAS